MYNQAYLSFSLSGLFPSALPEGTPSYPLQNLYSNGRFSGVENIAQFTAPNVDLVNLQVVIVGVRGLKWRGKWGGKEKAEISTLYKREQLRCIQSQRSHR